jgi:predicted ferric reductase
MFAYRPLGLILILASVALPLVWFLPLAAARDPLAVLSHYLGSAALILMGLSQLMATRWPGVESIFGGLDRVYVLHKWVGIAALALVLLHDTIDADIRGLGDGSALEEFAETLGEISLYGLLILVVLSIATFVPYRLWYRTHQFMGAFFAASAIHFLFIAKPFAIADPPGIYVGAFCLLGVVAYAWTLLPARRFARERPYVVAQVEQSGAAVAVTLQPEGRRMRHRPGQFAFLRFDMPGLHAAHPFTISGAPAPDGRLRFSIKPEGEWTGALSGALAKGATARVEGPYGHFTPRGGSDAQVWIAAGIGITPFLAWANALAADAAPVHLFYCVRTRADAAHLEEVEALAESKPALHLHLVESATSGRLNAAMIQQRSGVDLARIHVFFCGPAIMRESLQESLSRLGVRPSRFHFEQFEMRSGIGLRKLAGWLTEAVLRRLGKEPAVLH